MNLFLTPIENEKFDTNNNKELGNCWEFWNCKEEIRNNCEIFKLNAGKECWFLDNISKGCKRAKEIGGCFNCKWFKKNNPNF